MRSKINVQKPIWPIRLVIIDCSLSQMSWKLIIRESESPQPASSSILMSRMTSSLVIIPYLIFFVLFKTL